MAFERGPVFRVVVCDRRFDLLAFRQCLDVARVVFDEAPRAVDLAIEVRASVRVVDGSGTLVVTKLEEAT